MTKESRDELLERILEETARNPYKKVPVRPNRTPIRKPVERPIEKPAEQVVEKTVQTPVQKPVAQNIDRTQVFSNAELNQAMAQQSAPVQPVQQTRSNQALQQELTQVLPAQHDFKQDAQPQQTVSQQEMQSAADKIQKIKQEKAAAAKAAIMRKAEIDNSRMMQNAENGMPPEPPVFTVDEDEEKVNIVMPEENEYDDVFDYENDQTSTLVKVLGIAHYFLVVAVLILTVFTCIFSFVSVSGDSMKPTLGDTDMIMAMNIAYTPQRGDVVIIDNKTAALLDENGNVTEKEALNVMISKRIIAVGGDTVNFDFEKGTVSVNNEVLEEEYISEPTTRDEGAFKYPLTVPEGYVFVLGDNRNLSKDSRHSDIGLVPADEITGKVIMKVVPFGMIK